MKNSVQQTSKRSGHPWGRAQLDDRKDPYRPSGKASEPTVCPQCGAVFLHGGWQWSTRPKNAHEVVCKACRRIKEKFPAGIITLMSPIAISPADDRRPSCRIASPAPSSGPFEAARPSISTGRAISSVSSGGERGELCPVDGR